MGLFLSSVSSLYIYSGLCPLQNKHALGLPSLKLKSFLQSYILFSYCPLSPFLHSKHPKEYSTPACPNALISSATLSTASSVSTNPLHLLLQSWVWWLSPEWTLLDWIWTLWVGFQSYHLLSAYYVLRAVVDAEYWAEITTNKGSWLQNLTFYLWWFGIAVE